MNMPEEAKIIIFMSKCLFSYYTFDFGVGLLIPNDDQIHSESDQID